VLQPRAGAHAPPHLATASARHPIACLQMVLSLAVVNGSAVPHPSATDKRLRSFSEEVFLSCDLGERNKPDGDRDSSLTHHARIPTSTAMAARRAWKTRVVDTSFVRTGRPRSTQFIRRAVFASRSLPSENELERRNAAGRAYPVGPPPAIQARVRPMCRPAFIRVSDLGLPPIGHGGQTVPVTAGNVLLLFSLKCEVVLDRKHTCGMFKL